MTPTKVLCDVYKTAKKDETYLYVKRSDGLKQVPEELLNLFSEPKLALTFVLTADKKLARLEADKLIEALDDKGYYLQMPPPQETSKLDLFTKLDKE